MVTSAASQVWAKGATLTKHNNTIDAAQSDVIRKSLQLFSDYLEQNSDPSTPVVEFVEPARLAHNMDVSLTAKGNPVADLIPAIEQTLRFSVRSGHPQFHNQLWGGHDTVASLGDLLTTITNTSMYTYEVAPVATLIEREVVNRLLNFAGFAGGEGIFCSGSSNANLIAMLSARNRAFPDVKAHGFKGSERPVAFVSDQSHYSMLSSAGVAGIGLDNLIRVESDDKGRMRPDALAREIAASRARGQTPFFVAATAGTTVAGAFDPIADLAAVCSEQGGIWLHVDGAWGAPALLSPTHRHLLDGLALADSLSWDAHKMMGVPLICAAFLTPHAGTLAAMASTCHRECLFHEHDEYADDLGKLSLQCGRRPDAIKLWLLWKHLGDEGFAARIDHLFALGALAREEVRKRRRLHLLLDDNHLNVCFRYIPDPTIADTPAAIDALNIEIREHLRRQGRALVNYSTFKGREVIRLVFANAAHTPDDIKEFFARFDTAAKECVAARNLQLSVRPTADSVVRDSGLSFQTPHTNVVDIPSVDPKES